MRASRWVASLCLLLAVAVAAACGSGTAISIFTTDGGGSGSKDGSGLTDGFKLFDTGLGEGGLGGSGTLTITPANKTLDVTVGAPAPTISYEAHLGTQVVTASWAIDRGELGTLNPSTGLFTAGETVGGVAHVTATYGKQIASTMVTVFLSYTENGGAGLDAGTGAGGVGGVGGFGPGGSVPASIVTVLDGTPTPDSTIGWLYPYDKTVWPQGILAPLLQWSDGALQLRRGLHPHHRGGVRVQGLLLELGFPPMTPFVNEPIPQAAWARWRTRTEGEPVTISLVFDRRQGDTAPSPRRGTSRTATLEGTVYYNSYGTHLAHQLLLRTSTAATSAARRSASRHGVARARRSWPGRRPECRVCHSVAAGGCTLVTQQADDYQESTAYALEPPITETAMAPATGIFALAGALPGRDVPLLTTRRVHLRAPRTRRAGSTRSPAGTAIASTGLPAGLGAATPVFSPDGTHVAFNFYGGRAPTRSRSRAMSTRRRPTRSRALRRPRTLTRRASDRRRGHARRGTSAVLPSFLPTNDAVVFELQTVFNGRDCAGTRSDATRPRRDRSGAQGELWWVDLATKTAARLDSLNGLPTARATCRPAADNAHGDDTMLNYEPTVNPVASGGYAWVVFTSRRMYGNVATINPSGATRATTTSARRRRTKKLWVAAIDLNAHARHRPEPPGVLPAGRRSCSPATRAASGSSIRASRTARLRDAATSAAAATAERTTAGARVQREPPACSQQSRSARRRADCCGATSGSSAST